MKKLVSRRILSVLLFCVVSTSVFGTAENDVRNDSLLLLCKSNGFDKLSQRCSHFDGLSDRSSELTSTLPYNSINGFTSAYIALSTLSAALFFLNYTSLFGNLLLLSISLLAFLACVTTFLNVISIPCLRPPNVEAGLAGVRKKVNSLKIILYGRVAVSFSSFRQLKQTAKDIALFFISHSLLNPIFSLEAFNLPPAVGEFNRTTGELEGGFFAPKGAVSPVIARLRHEAAAICPNEGLHPISRRPLAPSPSRPLAPSPSRPLAPSPSRPIAPSPYRPVALSLSSPCPCFLLSPEKRPLQTVQKIPD